MVGTGFSVNKVYLVAATQNVRFNSSLSNNLVLSLDTQHTAATAEACSVTAPGHWEAQFIIVPQSDNFFFSLGYILTLYILG